VAIIRRRLKTSDVAPDDIRYNPDTGDVERLIDGVWTPAPESDPRLVTTLPPRVTSDTRCDAAASIADALENQIAEIITAIENGKTAFTIAGLILGLFTFGVFAIFITIALFIANLMLDSGSVALEAALTPAVFDTLKCIIYCHMNGDGRIIAGTLPLIQDDVDTYIGGLGATVINAMLSLAGEGGLNNLAAKGTSTGDCSSCGCDDTWCYLFDFENVDNGGWARVTGEGDNNGTYSAGWNTSDAVNTALDPDVAQRLVNIGRTFSAARLTKFEVRYDLTKGTFDVPTAVGFRMRINGSPVVGIAFNVLTNTTIGVFSWDGDISGVTNLQAFIRTSRDQSSPYAYSGSAKIKSILIEGLGNNPIGANNC
jgi:hypothetical protein